MKCLALRKLIVVSFYALHPSVVCLQDREIVHRDSRSGGSFIRIREVVNCRGSVFAYGGSEYRRNIFK